MTFLWSFHTSPPCGHSPRCPGKTQDTFPLGRQARSGARRGVWVLYTSHTHSVLFPSGGRLTLSLYLTLKSLHRCPPKCPWTSCLMSCGLNFLSEWINQEDHSTIILPCFPLYLMCAMRRHFISESFSFITWKMGCCNYPRLLHRDTVRNGMNRNCTFQD